MVRILLLLALSGAFAQKAVAGPPQVTGRATTPSTVKPSLEAPKTNTGPARSNLPWWSDPAVAKELGLSAKQAAKIQELADQRARDAAPFHDELQRQEAILDRLVGDRQSSEGAFSVQLSIVAGLQSRLNQGRSLMLFRMHRIMTTDQVKKLEEIRGRRGGAR